MKTKKKHEVPGIHLSDLVISKTKELEKLRNRLNIEIAKKKKAESRLAESLKKGDELRELKSRFVAMASHELRTPLTSLLTSIELIQKYHKKWDELKFNQHVERIKNSVASLTHLLEEVLIINQVKSEYVNSTNDNSNILAICNRNVETIKKSYGVNHKLVFTFLGLQKNYKVDNNQIELIIVNLLSNAVKFSPKGSIIELVVFEEHNKLYIKVKDEGIGVPNDDILKIFEPFYRASNADTVRGLGLGLSIVKKAVDYHRGIINVESKLGIGTTLTIVIPLNTKQPKQKHF